MGTYDNINCSEAQRLLKYWREENIRKSEDTVDIFQNNLKSNISQLGNETWLIYEQVLIASLDCGKYDVAKTCFRMLERKFPKSHRVAKLYGYILESHSRFKDADELYDTLLSKDPANALLRKRKISILKSQNKIVEATLELNEYLKIFMSDAEAWHELGDLYLSLLEYEKAGFCTEELIITNSRNYLYHQKYAEIKYSIGGIDNLETARCHFCFAYKLNRNNIRALYGITLSSSSLLGMSKGNAKKLKENQLCLNWASNLLTHLYKQKRKAKEDEEICKNVTKTLDSLQITPSS